MPSRVSTKIEKTETRYVRAQLQHPRKGLTVDDLGVMWKAAVELGIPGDAIVHHDISYGEGTFRGGLSISHKVEITDEPQAEEGVRD